MFGNQSLGTNILFHKSYPATNEISNRTFGILAVTRSQGKQGKHPEATTGTHYADVPWKLAVQLFLKS